MLWWIYSVTIYWVLVLHTIMCRQQRKKLQLTFIVFIMCQALCFICIISFILPETLLLPQFCRWEHWSLETLMNLSKITQLVSTRAGTQIQMCLIPDSDILNTKAEAESHLLNNSHIPHCKTMCMNAGVMVCRKFRVQRRLQLILPGDFTQEMTLWLGKVTF